MKEIKLKGGLSVPLFGSVEKFKVEDLEPKFIGILSEDYFGLKPKFLASEGDLVRVGQPIVEDKTNQEKNISHEFKNNEIFKASDTMVDALTQLIARKRAKNIN